MQIIGTVERQMKINYEGKDKKGMILRIERSSIYDGEGFRTVVFLKGCPLRCQWCSTPESQSFQIEETETNTYGQVMTVEEVLKEVRKDSPFYFHSGGGMTLSGGELLAQPDFATCLLRQARKEGIDTAIETAFFGQWQTIETLLKHVNTAFVDLKFVSRELHEKYCGVGNDFILQNLMKTNTCDAKFQLIVRIPLIPGINDSEEELRQMAVFCSQLDRMEHLQLLPYHRLGTDTYRKLGRAYKLETVEPPSAEHMERCRAIMREYVEKVR